MNTGRGHFTTRALLAAALTVCLVGAGNALAAGGGGHVTPTLTPSDFRNAQLKAQAARDAALAAPSPAPSAPMAAATMAMPGGVPNYFGPEPNWAWSPNVRKFVDSLPGVPDVGLGTVNGLGQYIPVAAADTLSDGSHYYEIALVQYTERMHSDLGPTTLRGYVQLNGPNAAASAGAAPGVDASGWPVKPHYLGPLIVAQGGINANAANVRPVRILFRNLLPTTATGGNLFLPVDTSIMGAGMYDINWDPQTKAPAAPHSDMFAQNRGTLHLHGGFTPWISDGTPHQWTVPDGEGAWYAKGASTASVPDMWFDPVTHAFAGIGATAPTTPNGPATNDPGPGAMTFYYANQQSAKLMFYHDHVLGLTRLNVYAGEAAGYLLTDPAEQALIGGGGPLAATSYGIPLVIQDKTFVRPADPNLPADPLATTATDPTWPFAVMAGMNDLWFPHVYMPNQNPADIMGMNAVGRWDYGPWFWPPWPVQVPSVPLGIFDPNTGAEINAPGVPDVSAVPEAMMDTPIINGTAYPFLDVPAGVVRFRVLNACNDRMLNLGIYIADPGGFAVVDPNNASLTYGTEVRTVPAVKPGPYVPVVYPNGWTDAAGNDLSGHPIAFPAAWTANDTTGQPGDILDGRWSGVPDPILMGPPIVQIGNEGGFLPEPVVVGPMTSLSRWPAGDPTLATAVQMPIGFDRDVKSMTVGNVKEHGLLLGPAERADILVDFTNFAGKTLILYNDAPSPLPANDSRLDYYTGNADQTAVGGTVGTLPGYGPNTRTILQFRVNGAGTPLDLGALKAAFAGPSGVFVSSQDPVIVPQGASGSGWNGSNTAGYNAAYGATFPTGTNAFVRLQDTSFTFTPLGGASAVTMPLQPKAIAEEFEDVAGRMQASLGVEVKFTNGTNQTTIFYGYHDPAASVLTAPDPKIGINTLAVASDGTQIWKITHNGVDTHPIHFHQFDVQLINRVHWDGMLQPPDPNEAGWKETVRMDPLEDVIVAARSRVPNLPFELPNSYRPFDTTMATGVGTMQYPVTVNGAPFTVNATNQTMFKNVDTAGNPVTVLNAIANYGWEYVWHCHILGHEEQDMMRPTAVAVPPKAASNLVVAFRNGTAGARLADFSWTDNSIAETGWTLQGANDLNGPWTAEATIPSTTEKTTGATVTVTLTMATTTPAYHRVVATDTVGSGIAGYPTATATSGPSNAVTTLLAPTLLTTALQGPGPNGSVKLAWTDNANSEAGFNVYRSTNGSATFTQVGTAPASNNTGGTVTYVDATVVAGNYYTYQVKAYNAGGLSDASNQSTIAVKAPAPPTNVKVTSARNGGNDSVTLTWTAPVANTANGPATGYTIQYSTSSSFPAASTTTVNVGPVTSWTQSGFARNTNYYFHIRSTNAVGTSSYVNAAPFPIKTP